MDHLVAVACLPAGLTAGIVWWPRTRPTTRRTSASSPRCRRAYSRTASLLSWRLRHRRGLTRDVATCDHAPRLRGEERRTDIRPELVASSSDALLTRGL